MQKKLLIQTFFIFFIGSISPFVTHASTVSEKPVETCHQEISPPQKHKSGILKSWLAQRMGVKMRHALNGSLIHNQARAGFIWGLITIGSIIGGIFNPSLLLLSIIASFVGFFKSIKALISIRKSDEPNQYKKERRTAIWGIVFSTVGLLAITALLITFAVFLV